MSKEVTLYCPECDLHYEKPDCVIPQAYLVRYVAEGKLTQEQADAWREFYVKERASE